MRRFEVTLTERDPAPGGNPAASKCKCKCGGPSGGAVPSAPDARGSREGTPDGQTPLSPLGE
jgi:hypothetical protein